MSSDLSKSIQSSLLSQAFLDESKSRITPFKRASTVNKFLCKWDNCTEMFDTRGQLMNHVRVLHTEPLEGILFKPQLTTTIEISSPEEVDFDPILDLTNESLTQEPVISDVQANLIIDPIGTKENVEKGKNSKKVKRHDRFNGFKKWNSTTKSQHSTSRIIKREFNQEPTHFCGNEVIPKRIKTMMITTNEQILPQAASTPFQPKIDETDLEKHLTDISKSVLRTPVELQSTTRSTRSTRSSVKLRTSNTGSELVESEVVLKDPPEQPNRKQNDSTTSNVSHSKMNKLFKCMDCNKPYMFEKHLLNHYQKIHQQPNKLSTQSSSSSSTTSPTTKPMSTKSKQAKSEQERLFVCPHVGCTSSFTIRDIYKHVQEHSKS